MPGRVFLDSNILVYAQDGSAGEKQRKCREVVSRLAESGDGVISTQVLQEPALIQEAVDCSVLNQLSFWDSLILAAASSAGCTAVFSEGLSAGQQVA